MKRTVAVRQIKQSWESLGKPKDDNKIDWIFIVWIGRSLQYYSAKHRIKNVIYLIGKCVYLEIYALSSRNGCIQIVIH